MRKLFREHFRPYMIRPIVYKTFARLVYGLTFALAWNRFANVSGFLSARRFAFPIVAACFAALAWFCFLRLDGVRLPEFRRKKSKKRRSVLSSYGDMADYADQHLISFDELTKEEQQLSMLTANGICCVIFGVISLF